MLAGEGDVEPEASEFLHLAATSQRRRRWPSRRRASARSSQAPAACSHSSSRGSVEPGAAARQAAAEGCDLSGGLVVAVTEVGSTRPREALSVVASEFPSRSPSWSGDRLYALLPARRGEPRAAADVGARAARLRADRARRRTTATRARSPRALAEAELVLEALAEDSPAARGLDGDGGAGRLPAAVPRARLRPRGGAPLLRGHGRAARRPRRAVPRRPAADARGLPGQRLQHERDRARDLRAPPHGRLPARAGEGADRTRPRARPRTASASGSG